MVENPCPRAHSVAYLLAKIMSSRQEHLNRSISYDKTALGICSNTQYRPRTRNRLTQGHFPREICSCSTRRSLSLQSVNPGAQKCQKKMFSTGDGLPGTPFSSSQPLYTLVVLLLIARGMTLFLFLLTVLHKCILVPYMYREIWPKKQNIWH